MRLLRWSGAGQAAFTQDLVGDDPIPPYAILSHTWGKDIEEVTFEDLKNGNAEAKAGYKKIQFCGEQAKEDGLEYFWVDTCCINKSNFTELSTAIVLYVSLVSQRSSVLRLSLRCSNPQI